MRRVPRAPARGTTSRWWRGAPRRRGPRSGAVSRRACSACRGSCTRRRLSISPCASTWPIGPSGTIRAAGGRHHAVVEGVRARRAVEDLHVVEVGDRAVVERREQRARLAQDQHVDVAAARRAAPRRSRRAPARPRRRPCTRGVSQLRRRVRTASCDVSANQARSGAAPAASRRRRRRCTPCSSRIRAGCRCGCRCRSGTPSRTARSRCSRRAVAAPVRVARQPAARLAAAAS